MRYIELTASVDALSAEAAADVLRAVAGGGISIDLPFVQRDLEADAEPRPGMAELRAYVPGEGDGGTLLRTAADAMLAAGIDAAVSQRTVDEADWAEAWKEHFHVERYGRIVVVPSWRTYDAAAGDVVLRLDPGMAFGTGQHETTRMCLEALDEHVRAGMRVLDAGCGSGILSVAAAKLNAADVLAVDIDPDCVRITRDNAAANGCPMVRAEIADPEAFVPLPAGSFDVIVANIVASTIIALTPRFVSALAPRGRLIASGIIAAREEEVRAALTGAGLTVAGVRGMGEWRCVQATKDGNGT